MVSRKLKQILEMAGTITIMKGHSTLAASSTKDVSGVSVSDRPPTFQIFLKQNILDQKANYRSVVLDHKL